ncbi:O-antigen ligase family protein [Myxococcota bacterium]|nr:O-antigen ligase family protein [Myxococcota bacterium]
MAVLVGATLAWQAFVPLEVSLGSLDVPLADGAAMGVALAWGLDRWAGRRRSGGGWARPPAVGRGVALLAVSLVAWALVAAVWAGDGGAPPWLGFPVRVHDWARWPLFDVVVYGVALRAAVAALGAPAVLGAEAAWFVGLSAFCLATSAYRILGGGATWIHVLLPWAHNHKSLAICLGVSWPLVWAWGRDEGAGPRRRAASRALVALGIAAVLLSFSRTALLAAAAGGAALWLGGARPRPGRLSSRPLVTGALAAGLAAAALAVLPRLLGLERLVDSTSTRIWLLGKAFSLVGESPWTGVGPGGFVGASAPVPAPSEVVAGLGPHGLLESLAAELGLPGLLLGGALAATTLLRLVPATTGPVPRACFATGAALLLSVLLSTETWTHTTWIPWAICLGLSPAPSGKSGASRGSP